MRKAILAGSFDPITLGHVDIVKRAVQLFDEVYVVVGNNTSKKTLFSLYDRIEMVKDTFHGSDKIIVDSHSGLIADYAKEHSIGYLIRGIRNSMDAQYEIELAMNNKFLNDSLETVILPASKEHMITSSSQIRQFITFGVDISSFVPSCVVEKVKLINSYI